MSKFNTTSVGTKTINKAYGEAYAESPKLRLASLLLTSFVSDQYYRSGDEVLEELRDAIKAVDPQFAAKAAIYGRNEYGMRSISHATAAEIANLVKGEPWTKRFMNKVVRRPDDVTEILAYYLSNYGKPVPNSMKKGLSQALTRFDEYQLGKYRGAKKDMSLVDAVNLVHPRSTEALGKLMRDELRSKTWETGLTQSGQKAESEEDKKKKKERVWKTLLAEDKLGYFALLRNLRNIMEQAPEEVDLALDKLLNKERLKKSLVLPFRFHTAIKEIEQLSDPQANKVVMALGEAIDLSVDNVPDLKGRTLIALDDSGSMMGREIEIGSVFTAVMLKALDSQLLMFSDNARHLTLNPSDSTLTLANQIMQNTRGGGTDFHLPFSESTQPYDRIIILSDMQGWMDGGFWSSNPRPAFNDYKQRTGTDPVVYSFDLAGYGTLQFPERNVYCLAGFSEKVFDIMKMLESDRDALINKIESIEI